MGNIVGKRDDMVDGGFPFPTGTVYQKIDCDLRIVSKLISELRVSPFYKGLPDTPDSSFIECPICFLVFGLHCTSLPIVRLVRGCASYAYTCPLHPLSPAFFIIVLPTKYECVEVL